jgi:hypothetical protein
MRCPRCGVEPRRAKFCNECAAPLPLHCDACGRRIDRGYPVTRDLPCDPVSGQQSPAA